MRLYFMTFSSIRIEILSKYDIFDDTKALWVYRHLAQSIDFIIHFTKILILKCERIIEKLSYECCVYERKQHTSCSLDFSYSIINTIKLSLMKKQENFPGE